MRIDFRRMIIAVFVMIIVQYLATYLLSLLNIYGIVSAAIVDFLVAFTLVFIFTPRQLRKYALKTTTFHYNVFIYFIILFSITLIQWIL